MSTEDDPRSLENLFAQPTSMMPEFLDWRIKSAEAMVDQPLSLYRDTGGELDRAYSVIDNKKNIIAEFENL